MNFFNQAARQIKDLFKSMTPGARVVTSLLVIVILLSSAFLVKFQAATNTEFLFGARVLSDGDIGRMELAFAKANLESWTTIGNRIQVPQGKKTHFMAALAAAQELPADSDELFRKVLLEDTSFLDSGRLIDLKKQYVLQTQAALTIQETDGIEHASVKISELKGKGFNKRSEIHATVSVRAKGRRNLSSDQIEGIRAAVASMIGANRENVNIFDLSSGITFRGQSTEGDSPSHDHVYASAKRMFENKWRDAIYDQLQMYDGVIVNVNVELYSGLESVAPFTPAQGPGESAIASATSQTALHPAPKEHPATLKTTSTALPDQNSHGSTRATSASSPEKLPPTSSNPIIAKQTALIPKTVTASISIPQRHFEASWAQRWQREHSVANSAKDLASPNPKDLQDFVATKTADIEELIKNLLPTVDQQQGTHPQVVVKTYSDQIAVKSNAPTLTAQSMKWLGDNWRLLSMIGVALFAILVLRDLTQSADTAAKSQPTRSLSIDKETTTDNEPETKDRISNGDNSDVASDTLPNRATGKKQKLHEELANLVRDDPNAAAEILKRWLQDAA